MEYRGLQDRVRNKRQKRKKDGILGIVLSGFPHVDKVTILRLFLQGCLSGKDV